MKVTITKAKPYKTVSVGGDGYFYDIIINKAEQRAAVSLSTKNKNPKSELQAKRLLNVVNSMPNVRTAYIVPHLPKGRLMLRPA